jgi:hypothetical protein
MYSYAVVPQSLTDHSWLFLKYYVYRQIYLRSSSHYAVTRIDSRASKVILSSYELMFSYHIKNSAETAADVNILIILSWLTYACWYTWYPCVMKHAETSGVMLSRYDASRFHFCTKLWAVWTRDRHCCARYGQPIGWRHLRTDFVCIHSVLWGWLSPHTGHCLQFVDVTTESEGRLGGVQSRSKHTDWRKNP